MTGPLHNPAGEPVIPAIHPGTVGRRVNPANSARADIRAQKIRELIDYMAVCTMTVEDVQTILKFSSSGARKYLHDLRDAGVVGIESHGHMLPTTYRITDDQARIDAFLAELDTQPLPSRMAKKATSAGASRQFHLMQDDTHFAVRIRRAPVTADPQALPREFFAPSTDTGPLLRAMPVIPPKPQGFPVPGQYRFELVAQP